MIKGNINISLKNNQINIKISDEVEQKQIMAFLNKKMPILKKMYKEKDYEMQIGGKVLKNKEMEEIQELIKTNLNVKVDFESPRYLGLHMIKKAFNKEIAESETRFHKGSLRSGQRIEYEGSLVILGDVNAGAEVIAEENIVVLGILRGLAHAGAKGNKEAIIAAAYIDSPQLRIANIVKEIEKDELDNTPKNYVYVDEGDNIIIE